MGRRAVPVADRFWKYVRKTDTCWLWTGGGWPNGYGQVGINGGGQLAHRVAWELSYGPIPPDLCVLHRCDTRRCVRPDHLFLGTNADNSADMVRKGRSTRGEAVRTARFTADQVRLIRQQYAAGTTKAELARRYDCTPPTIHCIVVGKTWKHVFAA